MLLSPNALPQNYSSLEYRDESQLNKTMTCMNRSAIRFNQIYSPLGSINRQEFPSNRSTMSTERPVNTAEFNLCTVKIPRCLKVSTKISDNDINKVRNKIRVNRVFHNRFNPSLESSEGFRYFSGVYNPNLSEYQDSSCNLYEYIVKNGTYKSYRQKNFITPLRTGFNIKSILQQREQQEYQKKQIEKDELKRNIFDNVKKMKWGSIMEDEDEKIYGMDNKRAKAVHESINSMLKRFEPSVKTSQFSVLRMKIEKLVEDGYSFKQGKDQKTMSEKILKSPLEIQFEEEKQKRIDLEEQERMKEEKEKKIQEDYRFTFLEGIDIQNKNSSIKTIKLSLANSQQESNNNINYSCHTASQNNTPTNKQKSSSEFLKPNITPTPKNQYLSLTTPNTPKRKIKWTEHYRNLKERRENEKLAIVKVPIISPQEEFLRQIVEIKSKQGKRKTEVPAYSHVKSLYHKKAFSKAATKRSLFEEVQIVREQYNLSNIEESEESRQTEVNYLQKNIENLRSMRSLFSLEKGFNSSNKKGSPNKPKSKISSEQTSKQSPQQQAINIFFQNDNSPRKKSKKIEKKDKNRNLSTFRNNCALQQAKRNSQIDVPTFVTQNIDQNEDQENKQEKTCDQGKSESQNDSKLNTFQRKKGILNKLVTKLENYDSQWFKQSEKLRQQKLKEIQTTQNHLVSAINRAHDIQITHSHIQAPLIENIMELKKEVDQFDHENFLSPQIIKEIQDSNFKSSVQMIKELNSRRIWKPTKFQLTKKSDMNELLKNFQ